MVSGVCRLKRFIQRVKRGPLRMSLLPSVWKLRKLEFMDTQGETRIMAGKGEERCGRGGTVGCGCRACPSRLSMMWPPAESPARII